MNQVLIIVYFVLTSEILFQAVSVLLDFMMMEIRLVRPAQINVLLANQAILIAWHVQILGTILHIVFAVMGTLTQTLAASYVIKNVWNVWNQLINALFVRSIGLCQPAIALRVTLKMELNVTNAQNNVKNVLEIVRTV